MNVTQRIFAIATEKRITLTELAEKCGLSYGTIASWKRRGTPPPADKITVIAEALDVPVGYLLDNANVESQRICNEYDSDAIVVLTLSLGSGSDLGVVLGSTTVSTVGSGLG